MRCTPHERLVLELAYTERAWRADGDAQQRSQRYEFLIPFGQRLAGVVLDLGLTGTVAERRGEAELLLSGALRAFARGWR